MSVGKRCTVIDFLCFRVAEIVYDVVCESSKARKGADGQKRITYPRAVGCCKQ